jgi:hypothetical protein
MIFQRSDIVKRQSSRLTLLCYSTICLFLFLILFLFLTEFFHQRFIYLEINSNLTKSLNLLKYRSSLIECGQSVVQKQNFYQILEQLTQIIKNRNKTILYFNKQLNKQQIIIGFQFILTKCFQARQFSIMEQQKPTIIRRIISILRKEFLYIAAFFIKDI